MSPEFYILRSETRQSDQFTLPWIKPIIGVFEELSWKVGWWRCHFWLETRILWINVQKCPKYRAAHVTHRCRPLLASEACSGLPRTVGRSARRSDRLTLYRKKPRSRPGPPRAHCHLPNRNSRREGIKVGKFKRIPAGVVRHGEESPRPPGRGQKVLSDKKYCDYSNKKSMRKMRTSKLTQTSKLSIWGLQTSEIDANIQVDSNIQVVYITRQFLSCCMFHDPCFKPFQLSKTVAMAAHVTLPKTLLLPGS